MTSLSDAKITKKTRVPIWQSLRTTVPITFLIPLITSAELLFFLVNQNIKEIAKKDFQADIEIIKQAINEELSDYFKQDNRTNNDAISLIPRNRKISDELDDIFKSHIEYSIFIVDESRNLIPASIKHKKNPNNPKLSNNNLITNINKKLNKDDGDFLNINNKDIISFQLDSGEKQRASIKTLSFHDNFDVRDKFDNIMNWRLLVVISEKDFMANYNNLKNQIYFLLFVTFMFSASLGLLLSNKLVKPILQLNKVAQQIEQGSITLEAENLDSIARRSDEIGEFAAVFKDMSQEIFAREQNLKSKVEELRQESDQVKKAALASGLSGNLDVRTLLSRSQQARRKVGD